MVDAKKNLRADALKKVKELYKSYIKMWITDGIFKGSLAESRKPKREI